MPEAAQLAGPVMAARTCLDADERPGQPGEEYDDLGPAKSPPQDASSLGIGAVHLENILGDIETDNGGTGQVTSF